MKKVLIFVLAVLLLATACQKTPEAEIVVQKDMDAMLGKAEAAPMTGETPALSLAERYGIPESYAYALTDGLGRYEFNVDAKVEMSGVTAFPIVRVEAADFTQAQVTGLFNALCGDEEMYYKPDVMTKAEIQDRILFYKKILTDEEYSQNQRDEMPDAIAYYESLYISAPEEPEWRRCYGELELKKIKTEYSGEVMGQRTALDAYNRKEVGEGVYFTVTNNSDITRSTEASDSIYIPERCARLTYRFWRSLVNFNDFLDRDVTGQTSTDPDAAATGLTISPAEAQSIAEKMLLSAGITDMAVTSVLLTGNFGSQEGQSPKATEYAYRVLCSRVVGSAPCAWIQGFSANYNNAPDGKWYFAPQWWYENMQILLDEQGIFYLSWESPLVLTETVNSNAQLRPFEDIAAIFEHLMDIKYFAPLRTSDEPDYENGTTTFLAFDIDRVTLSLQRVNEQDSFTTGLLIPVWNFYGTKRSTYVSANRTFDETRRLTTSILSINAIDGSTIDVEQGY